MFGYVTIAAGALTPEQQVRYRAFYCGLCHALGRRHGQLGRMTLSYDATFLYLLLTSLYEPETAEGSARCLPHPFKPHAYVQNELADYCCDMNIALAYHKCLDDWQDDHSLTGRAEAALLKQAYDRVYSLYPDKCREIERCLKAISALEKSGESSPDTGANLSARMLGVIYRFREDMWADALVALGEGLGRFVYLMDAYDDLEADLKKGRYNPLCAYHDRDDYETFVKDSLTLLIGEATEAFETLPLVQDMDILRNILYSGCWSRYQLKQQKRNGSVAETGKNAGQA
ncbi:MAG: hypothetical protein IKJ26_08930 [Clostridia bacterium]|nr:hypothetical protein [Clostridia bacterium]